MINAYFSNIKDKILHLILSANNEILVAVAWFTHRDIFHAIISALDKGVCVNLILINDMINRSPYGLDFSFFLQKGGKLCFVDSKNILMHNKFFLVDNKTLVTGSYNWTYSAERCNAENIIETDDSVVCDDYRNYFMNLWNSLNQITEYLPVMYSDVEDKDFLRGYDNLVEELNHMSALKIVDKDLLNTISEQNNNISIIKLSTIRSSTERYNPTLNLNVGMRCRINGINDMTLNIIKGGQVLPYTNKVITSTTIDEQQSVLFDILLGHNDIANDNISLVKFDLSDLPKLKAGLVSFETKVTLDTTGYMHVECVCINTGQAKETFYMNTNMVSYKKSQ